VQLIRLGVEEGFFMDLFVKLICVFKAFILSICGVFGQSHFDFIYGDHVFSKFYICFDSIDDLFIRVGTDQNEAVFVVLLNVGDGLIVLRGLQ
jgi:hypothetical protein